MKVIKLKRSKTRIQKVKKLLGASGYRIDDNSLIFRDCVASGLVPFTLRVPFGYYVFRKDNGEIGMSMVNPLTEKVINVQTTPEDALEVLARLIRHQQINLKNLYFDENGRLQKKEIPDLPEDRTVRRGSVKGLEIKDSGDRTQFGTGAVRDMHTGKGRHDLLPFAAIDEIAKHMENGAIKYGERNWEKGIDISSYLDSSIRHLSKYMQGHKDEKHLVAAAWNLLCAIETEIKKPELQNIPSRKE